MEENLTLNVILQPSVHFTEEEEPYPLPKDRSLTFSQYPQTGLEVKRRVQDKFNIPLCLQTIYFNSFVLEDNQKLRNIHLREGDTLTVSYTTHGDLSTVQDTLKSMKQMLLTLTHMSNVLITNKMTPTIERMLDDNLNPFVIKNLIDTHLVRMPREKAEANHLYFVCNGGLRLGLKIHKILSSIPWEKHILTTQMLEHHILNLLFYLSSKYGVRILMKEHPGIINQLSKSVLRVQITPHKAILSSPLDKVSATYGNALLTETMYQGMNVIVNLSELTECQIEIVKIPELIEQLAFSMLSPSYSIICPQTVISTFLCLSYSPKTHNYLTAPVITHTIFEVCKIIAQEWSSRNSRYAQTQGSIIIVKYFITLFFAFVGTGSETGPQKLEPFLPDIVSLMHKFLRCTTPQQVYQSEVESGYFESTFKPYVSLCYFDYNRKISSPLCEELPLLSGFYQTCIRAGIFSLQTMSYTDDFKEIVENEQLHDYLMCLPWYMRDDELREEAEVLYRLVQTKIKTSCPPTLVNLIKGYLATNAGFTLQELMSSSFIETLDQRLTYK